MGHDAELTLHRRGESAPMSSSEKDGTEKKSIGPYRIEGQIGSGGMGAVYRAYDERLERAVALKRFRTEKEPGGDGSSAGRDMRERLLTEAKAIAQLSHPNIVQVYDFLAHDGVDWIVMELVDGRDLRSLVKEGGLSPRQILRYAVDIARGLAAAHARGIVHRDLKTENVIVTSADQVKILDFGLAKQSVLEVESGVSEVILGTPRSMAPEQALGQSVDHRADLFSFGVLIYECFAGESPFLKGRRGVFQVLTRVCNQPHPPMAELAPEVSKELSDLVDRLLEKRPEDRPSSIEEVLVELQRIATAPAGSLRVLFVDDEPDIEPLIRQWFRAEIRAGRLDPRFAANGEEALSVLRSDPSVGIVMTDLNMPIMDGLTLIANLAKLDRPVVSVVVSAFGDMKNIRSAMNLGAYDFLIKPIDFEDLQKTLAKAAEHAFKTVEHVRLQAQAAFLEERNQGIRQAFTAYLRGDSEIHQLVEPLLEQALDSRRFSIILSLRIGRLREMASAVPGDRFFVALSRFLNEVVGLARDSAGTLIGLDLKNGRLSLGFGPLTAREHDRRRALDCAMELRTRVGELGRLSARSNGPWVPCKIVVESTSMLGEQGPDLIEDEDSDALSSAETIDSLFERCSEDQIYVVETGWLSEHERASFVRTF